MAKGFKTYQAVLAILVIPQDRRTSTDGLMTGKTVSLHAISVWQEYFKNGRHKILTAGNTAVIRRQEAPLPITATRGAILKTVWDLFKYSPAEFEAFSIPLFNMRDSKVTINEITGATSNGVMAAGPPSLEI